MACTLLVFLDKAEESKGNPRYICSPPQALRTSASGTPCNLAASAIASYSGLLLTSPYPVPVFRGTLP